MTTPVTPICFAPSAPLADSYQQQWFLVDTDFNLLSAQACQGLEQLQIQVHMGQLQLRAPGMLRLELLLDVLEDDDEVRCNALTADQTVIAAIDEGDLAATWFSHVVGQPCRLLKKDPGKPKGE